MLGLMGFQLARVSKAPATNAAIIRLHVTVLHHVPLEVAGLSEGFVANVTFVRPGALMGQHVSMEVAQLLEGLPALRTSVRLDATVSQNMRHEVVFGRVRLLTYAALPTFLTAAHINVIAVIDLNVDVNTLNCGLLVLQSAGASIKVSQRGILVKGIPQMQT